MSEPLPQVKLSTNFGDMTIELYEDDAPNTVANFISLIESGFYNGTRSHRVIKDFMIQMGDPNTKDPAMKSRWGTGGPGYCIDCEVPDNRVHDAKGTLSMAHAGPNTGGSQFFITHGATPHLNGVHTVFGKVVGGLEVVDAIANVPCGGPSRSDPQQDVVVNTASVISKRNHPYEPKKNANKR